MSLETLPASRPILALALALQTAHSLYEYETLLARDLDLPAPPPSRDRAARRLAEEYAPALGRLGLPNNDETFHTLMALHVDNDIRHTTFDQLPVRYRFEPRSRDEHGDVGQQNADSGRQPCDGRPVTIEGHNVRFWLRGEDAPSRLDDDSISHVARMIRREFREGELCVVDGDNEFRGWWELHDEV